MQDIYQVQNKYMEESLIYFVNRRNTKERQMTKKKKPKTFA